MENKCKLRISVLLCLLILGGAKSAHGQTMTYINDKSKTYQLRSMENGKWEFHPGWYYVIFHKKYSGGYWKGINIGWDVKKSDVGQIGPVRTSEVGIEAKAAKHVQNQIDSIQPIANEETIRSAERMADAIYFQYESKFQEAFVGIDEMTTMANIKSNGELLEEALRIIEEKDLLKEEIDYIHDTGPTKQMEQAKRQLAYEEVLKKLENLYSRSCKLAYYAQTLYNLNQSKNDRSDIKSYTSRNGVGRD